MKPRLIFVIPPIVFAAFLCLATSVKASLEGADPGQPNTIQLFETGRAKLPSWRLVESEGDISEQNVTRIMVAMLDTDFQLVGTVVMNDSRDNIAIFEFPNSGIQKSYSEGDKFGEFLIKKILYGKVIINDGQQNIVFSTGFRGVLSSFSDSAFQQGRVEREELEAAFPDYGDLMQAIRFRAYFEGGKPEGFIIYNIETGSIFERLGLMNGDVILNVNRKAFATTQPVVEFFRALKQEKTMSVEVKRGDSTKELYFEFL